MATRSRVLQYLAVAALPIVALLSGCAASSTSGPKAFRYGVPSQPLVEIGSDCKVYPEGADPEYPERVVVKVGLLTLGDSRGQVLWHVVGKQAGDQVLISSEHVDVFRAPHTKGEPIRDPLFPSPLDISASNDAIRSGSLKAALPFLRDKDSYVLWTYSIKYLRDGKTHCEQHSPEVCIQKWGSSGCAN